MKSFPLLNPHTQQVEASEPFSALAAMQSVSHSVRRPSVHSAQTASHQSSSQQPVHLLSKNPNRRRPEIIIRCSSAAGCCLALCQVVHPPWSPSGVELVWGLPFLLAPRLYYEYGIVLESWYYWLNVCLPFRFGFDGQIVFVLLSTTMRFNRELNYYYCGHNSAHEPGTTTWGY